jgi:hypothetical protein
VIDLLIVLRGKRACFIFTTSLRFYSLQGVCALKTDAQLTHMFSLCFAARLFR